MAHKKNYQNGYLPSSEKEQPDGWFDPQQYARNREREEEGSRRRFVRPEDDMRTDLPSNQGWVQYGRANYVSGQDPHSGFPNYRNVEQYDPGRRDDDIRSRRPGNMYAPTRYNEDRRYYEQYGSDRYSNDRYGSNWRRDEARRQDEERAERNWWDRTSDEIASWFGDDDAERRRRMDKINGPHQGKGPKGYTRTDERMREEINERLYHDSYIDASDIEVKVKDGEAILSGTVENRMIKRRVEDIAESVSGIRDVENHLKVKQHDSTTVGDMNYNSGNTDMTKRNWS